MAVSKLPLPVSSTVAVVSTRVEGNSAHVVVRANSDCHAARRELSRQLARDFGLEHTTLQVEHETPQQLVHIEDPR